MKISISSWVLFLWVAYVAGAMAGDVGELQEAYKIEWSYPIMFMIFAFVVWLIGRFSKD